MCDELYLFLDTECRGYTGITTYRDTLYAINRNISVVHTTQPAFLQFKYAKRLFVVVNTETHEITLGKCEGTDKEIHKAHNIEKMLLNGAFDWYRV